MTTSGTLRVVAAFVIGVGAALGTALVYVNGESARYVQPTVEAASPIQQPPAVKRDIPLPQDLHPPVQTASTESPAAEAVPQTSDVSEAASYPAVHDAKRERQTVSEPKPAVIAPVRKSQPAWPPIQIAQNSPHNYPAISTPSAPEQVSAPTTQIAATPAAAVTEAPVSQPSMPTTAAYSSVPEPPVPTPAPRFQPHTVALNPGTSVMVRLGETISSDHNYSGDTFRATLMQPIIRNGFIIADKGSKVLGRVINVQRPGRVQGVGDLALTLTEINTTDGQRVRIVTDTFDKRGPNNHLSDAAKIASGAGVGAIIGALSGGGKGAAIGAGVGGAAGTAVAFVTRGHDAEISTETPVVFRLTNPVVITEKLRF